MDASFDCGANRPSGDPWKTFHGDMQPDSPDLLPSITPSSRVTILFESDLSYTKAGFVIQVRALSSEERAAAVGKLGKIKCENERLRICSEKDCGSSERYILSMVKSLIANLNYLGLFAERE